MQGYGLKRCKDMSNDVRRILVAEDNPALLQVVSFNLEQAGFQVTRAGNGRKAWELLNSQHHDLVITDHQMPEMTGWDLCVEMSKTSTHAQTPVIFLTAKKLEIDATQLKSEFGVVAVFAKPFSPRELVCAVEDLLAPAAQSSHA